MAANKDLVRPYSPGYSKARTRKARGIVRKLKNAKLKAWAEVYLDWIVKGCPPDLDIPDMPALKPYEWANNHWYDVNDIRRPYVEGGVPIAEIRQVRDQLHAALCTVKGCLLHKESEDYDYDGDDDDDFLEEVSLEERRRDARPR